MEVVSPRLAADARALTPVGHGRRLRSSHTETHAKQQHRELQFVRELSSCLCSVALVNVKSTVSCKINSHKQGGTGGALMQVF